MQTKKKKFNLYTFLNPEYEKKDALEDKDAEKMGLQWFFKLLGRRFSSIFSVNILFVLGNFPAFFLLVIFSGMINDHSIVPQSLAFSNFYGASAGGDPTPLTAVLQGFCGSPVTENEYNIPLLVLFIGLSCLLFFTFGPVNCGCAHILRSVIRRDPVFLWQDFFGAAKKNFKQGLLLGIFDLAFLGIIVYDIMVFYMNYAYSFIYTVSFFFSIGVLFLYLFARMYMYMLCITFELKFFKLLKNSVIFAFLGFKRNVIAFVGQALLVIVMVSFLITGPLMALGAVIPLVILFGLSMYMSYFASYKVIKKYMIDPYYDKDGSPIGKEERVEE